MNVWLKNSMAVCGVFLMCVACEEDQTPHGVLPASIADVELGQTDDVRPGQPMTASIVLPTGGENLRSVEYYWRNGEEDLWGKATDVRDGKVVKGVNFVGIKEVVLRIDIAETTIKGLEVIVCTVFVAQAVVKQQFGKLQCVEFAFLQLRAAPRRGKRELRHPLIGRKRPRQRTRKLLFRPRARRCLFRLIAGKKQKRERKVW